MSVTKQKAVAVAPKKNNPVMDKMETRAQERERKRQEILRKKQEQKEAEEKAQLEEQKQKVIITLTLFIILYRNLKLNARKGKRQSN